MYIGVPAMMPDLRQAGVVDGAGQAEVGDLDALHAVLQQNVGRLDVAVDQALLVGGRQSAAVCMPMRRISLTSSGPPLLDAVVQGDAGDVLHDQVGTARRR